MEQSTSEIWVERVAKWQESGQSAEIFSKGEGYAASTLRWWASRLRKMPAAPIATPLKVVRVVRADDRPAPRSRPFVLEIAGIGVRLAIEPGADRDTLAMILDVVSGGEL